MKGQTGSRSAGLDSLPCQLVDFSENRDAQYFDQRVVALKATEIGKRLAC